MKRNLEDTVTLKLNLKQLAKLYAVTGKANGSMGSGFWFEVRDLVDPKQEKYNSFMLDKPKDKVMDYMAYEQEWLEHLFGEEDRVTVKIKELENSVKEMQNKIEELKQMKKEGK